MGRKGLQVFKSAISGAPGSGRGSGGSGNTALAAAHGGRTNLAPGRGDGRGGGGRGSGGQGGESGNTTLSTGHGRPKKTVPPAAAPRDYLFVRTTDFADNGIHTYSDNDHHHFSVMVVFFNPNRVGQNYVWEEEGFEIEPLGTGDGFGRPVRDLLFGPCPVHELEFDLRTFSKHMGLDFDAPCPKDFGIRWRSAGVYARLDTWGTEDYDEAYCEELKSYVMERWAPTITVDRRQLFQVLESLRSKSPYDKHVLKLGRITVVRPGPLTCRWRDGGS